MPWVDVVAFVAGVVLVAVAVDSAVRTMVVPRGVPVLLVRVVFVAIRMVFVTLIRRSSDYAHRDRVMALYAPLSLVSLPVVWLTLVAAGYTAMFWALGDEPVRQSFSISGSSLLTLGFVRPEDLPSQLLSFTEAAVGLGLLAVLITYLPSLYTTFSRREATVALLESRAGGPHSTFGHGPSGAEMLWRYASIGWQGGLVQVWEMWEAWFVELEESHTSLPALAFFRSPQPDRSWVTAAGAVLDAASLAASSLDEPRDPEAELCIRAGYVALRRIADFFGIPYDPDPRPDDPVSVTREEYEGALDYLAEAGLPVKHDRDAAWRSFAGWRVNYDTVLLSLASLTVVPPAVWSGDRADTVGKRWLAGRALRKRRRGRRGENG